MEASVFSLPFEHVQVQLDKHNSIPQNYDLKDLFTKIEHLINGKSCSLCEKSASKLDCSNYTLYCTEHSELQENHETFIVPQVKYTDFCKKVNRIDSEIVRVLCLEPFTEIDKIRGQYFSESEIALKETFTKISDKFKEIINGVQS